MNRPSGALITSFILVGFIFPLGSNAQAILPMPGAKSTEVVNTRNVYGSCGKNVVAILGTVEYDVKTGDARFDQSGSPNVLIRNANADKSLAYALSDYNQISCVSGSKGDFLVIGSSCAGSACGDEMSYTIMHMKSMFVFPQVGSDDVCDQQCVQTLTGSK